MVKGFLVAVFNNKLIYYAKTSRNGPRNAHPNAPSLVLDISTRRAVSLGPIIEVCYVVGDMGTCMRAFLERYFTGHAQEFVATFY